MLSAAGRRRQRAPRCLTMASLAFRCARTFSSCYVRRHLGMFLLLNTALPASQLARGRITDIAADFTFIARSKMRHGKCLPFCFGRSHIKGRSANAGLFLSAISGKRVGFAKAMRTPRQPFTSRTFANCVNPAGGGFVWAEIFRIIRYYDRFVLPENEKRYIVTFCVPCPATDFVRSPVRIASLLSLWAV